MTPLIQRMFRMVPESSSFMWFDLGEVPGGPVELAVDGERLTHLPFDRTAVCGRDAHGWEFALILFGGNGSVSVSGTMFGDGKWHVMTTFGYMDTPEGLKLIPHKVDLPPRDKCMRSIAIVDHFLTALEKAGTMAYRASPIESYVNRKRMAKGKPPTVKWNTVVVAPRVRSGDRKGGTHASPRQHERRGHWRNRNGKRFWIKNATVGKKDHGQVGHDYLIRAQVTTPSGVAASPARPT